MLALFEKIMVLIKYFAFVYLFVVIECRFSSRFKSLLDCPERNYFHYDKLPDVVLTGFVEQIYPSYENNLYSGSIVVREVFRGPKRLEENRVTIDGFGTQKFCDSNVKKRDTWIFFLNQISDGHLRLNDTLRRINLQNLDRINAVVRDEPYRRRPQIQELICETKYCPNNAVCVENPNGNAHCECLTHCSLKNDPVCASNGETFVNECKMRMDTCRRNQNLFVRHLGTCEAGRQARSLHALSQVM